MRWEALGEGGPLSLARKGVPPPPSPHPLPKRVLFRRMGGDGNADGVPGITVPRWYGEKYLMQFFITRLNERSIFPIAFVPDVGTRASLVWESRRVTEKESLKDFLHLLFPHFVSPGDDD